MVQRSHPLGVAFRQVIVDSDQVHALALKRIEVERQAWQQGSCLRPSSFPRSSPMKNHTADQLDVEMAHASVRRRLLGNRKGFRQKVIQGFSGIEPLAEFLGLVPTHHRRGESVPPQAH